MFAQEKNSIQRLKDFGFNVVPGPKEVFGGAVTVSLKGESVDLELSDVRTLSDWLMGTGQKVHNTLSD